MLSKKLVEILKTFDSQDWRDFSRYVQSPFFNRNDRLIAFVDLLRKSASNLDALTKQQIYTILYPSSKDFEEQKVYDHVAFLMRLLEGFLAYQEFQEDTTFESRFLLKSFVKRNLPDHFEKHFKRQKQKQTKSPFKNYHYHLSRFFIEREANYLAIMMHQPEYVEITDRMVDHLDHFLIASRLEYACNRLVYQKIWNFRANDVFLEDILDFLQGPGTHFLNSPNIAAYFHIYNMLGEREDTEQHYRNLKTILGEHQASFTQEEKYTLYGYAQNYVTTQLNAGKSEYLEEIFRIFQEMLTNDAFLFNGYLDAGMYKNIVTVGLRLRQYDWVQRFLDEYRSFLHPSHQNPAYHYNVAAWHYAKQEYSKALRELLMTDLIDVYYHLNVRQMQLKIYFEQEEHEALNSLIDAFSSYLKRNKQISDTKKEGFSNLVRFIRKAARLRQRSISLRQETFEAQKENLLNEIDTVPNLPIRSWLREHVEGF
jgi:hypothetical protein